MKGVLHVHSTFSDGELSLPELRREYERRGYRFACLTDHAEHLDADAVAAYRAQCDELSDDRFRFVAGLEYECPGRMHILGLGTTALIETRDPQAVIREIALDGGVSIIAHPRTQDFGIIRAFAQPADGIEVWNSKYDGRYAPRAETFALVRSVREEFPNVRAFYGQDLHFRNQYTGLHVELASSLDSLAIVEALRAGDYVGRTEEFRLAPDGTLDPALGDRFTRAHSRSRRVRRLAGRAKALLDLAGLGVPQGVKTQLRRLF